MVLNIQVLCLDAVFAFGFTPSPLKLGGALASWFVLFTPDEGVQF